MKKITLLDGAFGTCLWEEAEKRNIEKTPTWKYNVDHPELLEHIVKAYDAAGSDIIYANTFVATNPEISNAGYNLKEVIENAMKIVRNCSNAKMAYSVGPLTRMMEPFGTLTKQEVKDIYQEAIDIAYNQDPDLVILETFLDIDMLEIVAKIALETKLSVFCTMSFLDSHKTLLGVSVDDMIERLEPLGVSAIGMNCSVGPESAVGIIDEFASKTKLPLVLKPNATKPKSLQNSGACEMISYSPLEFANFLKPAFNKVSYLGACCGSNPDFIKALADII